MENIHAYDLPIARAFSLDELPGWLGKRLDVPQGKQGIIIDASGRMDLVQQGKPKAITPLARINGKGIGLMAGYIPADEFQISVSLTNLLSGDDALLDADILFSAKVNNPRVFFTKLVVPQRELHVLPVLEGNALHKMVEKVTQLYEREDALRHVPTHQLTSDTRSVLGNVFSLYGLQLVDIPMLLLRRSEDRLLVDEKLAELETALAGKQDDEDAHRHIEAAANQLLPGSISLRSGEKHALTDVVSGLRRVRLMKGRLGQHWVLKALRNPSADELDAKTNRALKRWRKLKIIWMSLLLLFGIGLTYLIIKLGFNMRSEAVIGFLLGTWGLLISLVVTAMKQLVQKQELIIFGAKSWKDLENARIVSKNDRTEVDRLVRQQCSQELRNALDVLNASRAELFRSGKKDLALKIKDLEKKIENASSDMLSSDHGTPFYLSDISISELDWKRTLDDEEELIAYSIKLGDMAENLRLDLSQASTDYIEEIGRQLFVIEQCFKDRARIG